MDKMRWRYGDTNPVFAAVDAETVIEIGDLLFQDVDDAKPAAIHNHLLTLVDSFLGVAMQRSRPGETDPIRVATTGVFNFDCPPGTFELGDYVGPSLGKNQEVSKIGPFVGEACLAIGRVAKRAATPVTNVLVDIRSTVMTGGVLVRSGELRVESGE